MRHLAKAIEHLKESLLFTPRDDPERLSRLNDLTTAYMSKDNIARSPADLDAVIQATQEMLDLAPETHASRSSWFGDLGLVYNHKYHMSEALEDIEMSLVNYRKCVDLTPDTDTERVKRLTRLADAHRFKYELLGGPEDFDSAVQLFQEAIDTADDDSSRAYQTQMLANAYVRKFTKTDALEDIDMAIETFELSLDLADTRSVLGDILNDLGNAYHERYRRTRTIADLESSIQNSREAADLAPEGDLEREARLNLLSSSLMERYNRIGGLADLNTCIDLLHEAVNMRPHKDHRRGRGVQGLQNAYLIRYRRTNIMADLDAAIEHGQEAVILMSDYPNWRADCLSHLATAYQDRYKSSGSESDFDESIKCLKEALETSTDGNQSRGVYFQSLGDAFEAKYKKTKVAEDIATAIKHYQDALDNTSADEPDRPVRLNSLATAYWYKFQDTEAISDVDVSLQHFQEAREAVPEDHYRWGDYSRMIGMAYEQRYYSTKSPTDFAMAIENAQVAMEHSPSAEYQRLTAGVSLFSLFSRIEDWSSAYDVATSVMSLIPRITSRSLQHSDKQHQLRDLVGFASKAASVAIMAGKSAYEAIQLLELGRGIIIGSLSEMRSNISGLQGAHPELADQFVQLQEQLDAPVSSDTSSERYEAAKKFDRLLADIRERPGFERFLLAPSEDDLKTAATSGPILIINGSEYHCDAFIITPKKIQCLNLAAFDYADIERRSNTLGFQLPDMELLRWLWDTVAEPVLNSLGLTDALEADWPRVWWIPVGPLAKFPMHAAGYHTDGSSNTVLDRVISSYSSSVKALIHSRQIGSAESTQQSTEGKVILIGMESTPGQSSLPYATKEVNKLAKMCTDMHLQVAQPSPYRDDVLADLRSGCKILHFAGHGKTSRLDPLQSALILKDGELTVSSLFDLNLQKQKPFMAYLSACGTGRIKDNQFIDEGLHLINACQLAGFRHVVGSLWEVNDESCLDVATTIYKSMDEHDISDDSVSRGLHRAARKLRGTSLAEGVLRDNSKDEKHPTEGTSDQAVLHPSVSGARSARDLDSFDDDDDQNMPLYWVPYVHFGV
jgi:CHAT domain-containing protein/tetratricopeptide (TPR) repeat protein